MRFRRKTMGAGPGKCREGSCPDIPHMSLYSLILENHAVFKESDEAASFSTKEELKRRCLNTSFRSWSERALALRNFSNFSKPGFESRHNLMYWDNAEAWELCISAKCQRCSLQEPWTYSPLYAEMKREMRVSKKNTLNSGDRNDGRRDASGTP